MAKLSIPAMIGLIVSLLLMGILLPIGLNDILGFTSSNSTVQTLVTTVIPVIAVVSLVMAFLPKGGNS